MWAIVFSQGEKPDLVDVADDSVELLIVIADHKAADLSELIAAVDKKLRLGATLIVAKDLGAALAAL